jgi:hypothetical protein
VGGVWRAVYVKGGGGAGGVSGLWASCAH